MLSGVCIVLHGTLCFFISLFLEKPVLKRLLVVLNVSHIICTEKRPKCLEMFYNPSKNGWKHIGSMLVSLHLGRAVTYLKVTFAEVSNLIIMLNVFWDFFIKRANPILLLHFLIFLLLNHKYINKTLRKQMKESDFLLIIGVLNKDMVSHVYPISEKDISPGFNDAYD